MLALAASIPAVIGDFFTKQGELQQVHAQSAKDECGYVARSDRDSDGMAAFDEVSHEHKMRHSSVQVPAVLALPSSCSSLLVACFATHVSPLPALR